MAVPSKYCVRVYNLGFLTTLSIQSAPFGIIKFALFQFLSFALFEFFFLIDLCSYINIFYIFDIKIFVLSVHLSVYNFTNLIFSCYKCDNSAIFPPLYCLYPPIPDQI